MQAVANSKSLTFTRPKPHLSPPPHTRCSDAEGHTVGDNAEFGPPGSGSKGHGAAGAANIRVSTRRPAPALAPFHRLGIIQCPAHRSQQHGPHLNSLSAPNSNIPSNEETHQDPVDIRMFAATPGNSPPKNQKPVNYTNFSPRLSITLPPPWPPRKCAML